MPCSIFRKNTTKQNIIRLLFLKPRDLSHANSVKTPFRRILFVLKAVIQNISTFASKRQQYDTKKAA